MPARRYAGRAMADKEITLKTLLDHQRGMESRLTESQRSMETRLGERLDRLESRVERLEGDVQRMGRSLTRQIDAIDKRLDELEIATLPERMSKVEKHLQLAA
jgi:hypothetical protein